MPRYIAFLRAINVGGHVVKMDHLRRFFEAMGFSDVETFIASGNVVFRSAAKNGKALEGKIGTKLREALGYEVATFIRTDAELAAIAKHQPFRQSQLDKAVTFCVAFLVEPLDKKAVQKLMVLRTEIDDFHVHGREIYWLSRNKQSESVISNAVFEKTIGAPSTMRGVNTVRKMAAKYAAPSS